jgi:Zn-dependent protease with chaperone function
MPFLLMVFLTLACLPDVRHDWPEPTWAGSLPGSVALTAATVLWLAGLAFVMSWRARHALARGPADVAARRYERARRRHQVALMLGYAAVLCVFGWGWSVGRFWRLGDRVLPGAELVVLAPFFLALFLSWLSFFDADRACFRATHPPECGTRNGECGMKDGATAPAQGVEGAVSLIPHPAFRIPHSQEPGLLRSRWAYVGYQARQKLALLLVPLGLLLAQKEAARLFPELFEDWQAVASLLGLAFVALVLLAMPWVLRVLLGLRPMPDGPLRRRLEATARRLGFRCGDLLVWNTGNGVANAMVVGLLPWPRYVVFTDRLLDEFAADEVEAVLGHEIGHVRHRHMLLYLFFLACSMTLFGALLAVYAPGSFEGAGDATAAEAQAGFWSMQAHPYLRALPPVGALLAYVFAVFGYLSRGCERQADLYGCRAVSCAGPDCAGHDDSTTLPRGDAALCPTGVRTFIRALERVALLNGISRDRPGFLQSWQHSTIARRVAFLERVIADPTTEPRFQRRLLLIKTGLLAVLGVALLLVVGV